MIVLPLPENCGVCPALVGSISGLPRDIVLIQPGRVSKEDVNGKALQPALKSKTGHTIKENDGRSSVSDIIGVHGRAIDFESLLDVLGRPDQYSLRFLKVIVVCKTFDGILDGLFQQKQYRNSTWSSLRLCTGSSSADHF